MDKADRWCFLVTSCYKTIKSDGGSSTGWTWKRIWKFEAPDEFRGFMRIVTHNACLTQSNLQRRGVSTDIRCFMCNKEEKNTTHLFSHCTVARQIQWRIYWTSGELRDVSISKKDMEQHPSLCVLGNMEREECKCLERKIEVVQKIKYSCAWLFGAT